MKHKYVRHSKLGVAIFPADTFLSHANIAEAMRYAMYEAPPNVDDGKVLSAGFVWIERDRVVVEGKSESLGIGQARPTGDQVMHSTIAHLQRTFGVSEGQIRNCLK